MADLRTVSREFLTEFIDLYRDYPCLWKIKSKDYSDKHMKNSAYEILIYKLKEIDPSANKDKVVKKINSLRTCFRKELKKVQNSKRSGAGTDEIYKPNLWYFDLLLFLSDQELPRKDVMDNIEEEDDSSSQIETAETTSDYDTPQSHVVGPVGVVQASASTPSTSTKSCRKKIDRSDEVLEMVAKRLETEGKYASFGQHIGEELKELPSEMAIYCKKIINDAIFMAQMGTLTRCSKIVNESNINTTSPPTTIFNYPSVNAQQSYKLNNTLSNYFPIFRENNA